MTVSRGDADKIKVEFFSRIKDSLKQRLEEFKMKNGSNGNN